MKIPRRRGNFDASWNIQRQYITLVSLYAFNIMYRYVCIYACIFYLYYTRHRISRERRIRNMFPKRTCHTSARAGDGLAPVLYYIDTYASFRGDKFCYFYSTKIFGSFQLCFTELTCRIIDLLGTLIIIILSTTVEVNYITISWNYSNH